MHSPRAWFLTRMLCARCLSAISCLKASSTVAVILFWSFQPLSPLALPLPSCIMHHTKKVTTLTLRNPSAMDVRLAWAFIERPSPDDAATLSVSAARPATPSSLATSLSGAAAVAAANAAATAGASALPLTPTGAAAAVAAPAAPALSLSPVQLSASLAGSALFGPAVAAALGASSNTPAAPINQVFDIIPLRATLRPGETQDVQISIYGRDGRRYSAIAVCEVEGGPTYEVALQGEVCLHPSSPTPPHPTPIMLACGRGGNGNCSVGARLRECNF